MMAVWVRRPVTLKLDDDESLKSRERRQVTIKYKSTVASSLSTNDEACCPRQTFTLHGMSTLGSRDSTTAGDLPFSKLSRRWEMAVRASRHARA